MSILLLSDAHLRGLTDPNQAELIAFLQASSFDELVIVGDLFDIWFVPGGSVPIQGLPVLKLLMDVVESGRSVTWVQGNHDWVAGVDSLGIQVCDRWEAVIGGRRVVAVHGDEGADPSRSHAMLDRLIHSRLASIGGRALGPARVWAIGKWVSSWSRGRPHDDHQEVLLRQNVLADRLLMDCDVVIMGHSHCPGRLPRPQGTLLNLGDWLEHRSFARIDAGEIQLYRWMDGKEVPLPDGPPQRWLRYDRGPQ